MDSDCHRKLLNGFQQGNMWFTFLLTLEYILLCINGYKERRGKGDLLEASNKEGEGMTGSDQRNGEIQEILEVESAESADELMPEIAQYKNQRVI